MDRIEELSNRARQWAIDREGDDPIPEIAALIDATDGVDRARLHTARASALQATEPGVAERDCLTAAGLYAQAGRMSDAAAAAATAAGMAEVGGDWNRAIQHAVDATIQLADIDLDDNQSVRASSALCAFYGHMGAFDTALPFGRRAVDALAQASDVPTFAPIYNLGYMTLEAAHSADRDDASRDALLDEAMAMANRLRDYDDTVTSSLLGGGLAAEVHLARGETQLAADAIDGTDELLDRASPTFGPWFHFVRASVLIAIGDTDGALPILDEVIPALELVDDDHCRIRALATRAAVRESTGDLAGALADERLRANTTRRWQITRTGQFAALVAAQAELERDGSLLRRQAGELARAASEDPLTGLFSRRWLSRRVTELEGLDAAGSVLLVDIDHFKVVNDTHGHGVGDRVLAAVADVLFASFRDGDVVRYGGEEFLVPMLTDQVTAASIAERARMAVTHSTFDEIVPDLRLTISIGVAGGPMRRIRELIDAADDALYVAKQSGRNRVVTADPLT